MSISDIKYENYELESALDEVAALKEKIKELKAERDFFRAGRDTWKDLADAHRDTIAYLRKELNETTDAYNELYDMVEHGST